MLSGAGAPPVESSAVDRVCMYCRSTYGRVPGEGVTHGICAPCAALSQDERDGIARAAAALRAVGAEPAAGDLVVGGPLVLLSPAGLARFLEAGAPFAGVELVQRSFRWAAIDDGYAREFAVRSLGRAAAPLVAALDRAARLEPA